MDIGDIKYLEAPEKVMKLSEAIRIGAKIRPQCVMAYFNGGASCALGSAYEAISGKNWLDDTPSNWEFFSGRFNVPESLLLQISLLNDRGTTREQIADWLEGQGY